jgi:hypothetical protein
LVLEAYQGGQVVAQDAISFTPFTSIIIGFVGEFGKRSDPGSGVNQMIRTLRDEGYDAHIFDEGDAPDAPGKGGPIDARDETNAAINGRVVTNVAIFGHSHGGGSTFALSEQLNRQLPYTAYIDAIQQPLLNTSPEVRRPIGSQYHENLYQRTGLIRGDTMGANANEDYDVRTDPQWLIDVNHQTIDNHMRVQTHIITGIKMKVPNR